MPRASIDLSNPYGLAPPAPLDSLYAGRGALPAKGARVGIRSANIGVAHPMFGVSYVPAIVDELTPLYLVTLNPTTGGRRAHWLCDAWLWSPAEDVTFYRPCLACRQLGEVLLNPGKICETCGGRKVVRHVPCADCNGFGVHPGSDLVVDCLECIKGAVTYDPFSDRLRRRHERRRDAVPTRAYRMPPLADGEGYEPPF